jgi:hypothetical protein
MPKKVVAKKGYPFLAKAKKAVHKRRDIKRVGSVRPGAIHRHSPTSPRDWRAWYEAPQGSPCPSGTHRAPGYDNIHSSKRYCVRNCFKWNPAKQLVKGGRCHKPITMSAWRMVLNEVGKAVRPMTDKLTGPAKKQAMMDIMVHAGEIYRKILGKGATMKDYELHADEIRAAI